MQSKRARKVVWGAMWFGVLGLMQANVQANTQDSTVVELETVEVTASEENLPITVGGLVDAKNKAHEIPGGANVVDSESYSTGRASTVQDALGYSPGVFVQPRFGAEESRLSIRGSGIQRTFHMRGIKLMQDGIPLNVADGGGDFQAIEPLAARYIEVFRGASALEYGSDTLGGAINYVMPTGYDADRFRLRVETGSFDYSRVMAASGGVNGDVDYFTSLSAYQQDGFRDWSQQKNARLFSNIGFRIAPDLETRFYASYVNTDSQLPGNLTKEQLEDNPKQANKFSFSGRQKRDFELARIANRTVKTLDNGQIEFSTYYSQKELWHPIYQVLEQRSDDYGVNVRYVNESPLAGHRNRFIVGMESHFGEMDDDRFVNQNGHARKRTADFDQEVSTYSLYGENHFYLLPELALVAGVQATHTTRNQDDLLKASGTDLTREKSYQRVSPKLGMIYDATPDIQFFSNMSNSFEPPSFSELATGTAVSPVFADAQHATTFEVGSRGELGIAQWDVALYRANVRKELLARIDPATGAPLGTTNADKTVHQGIEAGLNLSLGNHFALNQVYLFNDFYFDDDAVFGDNRIAGIPRHFYKAELLYQGKKGFYAGPNVEWSPEKYYVDHANTVYADPYALLGFKLGVKNERGISWFVEGKNLTNQKYAATTGVIDNANGIDQAQYLPGDGRSVFVGIDFRM
ncbi:MAG: TonB-dependent receptor [Pseudomonadales bacterium]